MIVGLASVLSGCHKIMNYESRSSSSIAYVYLEGEHCSPAMLELRNR